MPALAENLYQLASDFEELARQMQMAIEASADDNVPADRMRYVRDKALQAALLARRALNVLPPGDL